MRKLWLITLLMIVCVSQAMAQQTSKLEFHFSLSQALQRSNTGALVGQ
ncbi:MAG: hypothetical protein QOK37_2128 [Thermoanaerobaculia bacterium]|jgi:hypothetical protein|nr:hypothetical protein [Thermoanaerobaculia bacterium]